MSSKTAIDAADKAGGEIIYTSEDVKPIVEPEEPKPEENYSNKDGHVFTSEDAVDMADARAVFSGAFLTNETTSERLARLKREVDDLESDMDGNSDAAMAEAVKTLQNRLAQRSLRISEAKLSEPLLKAESSPTEAANTSAEVSNDLLERLQRLEATMGSSASDPADLYPRLQKLEQMVAHVDPQKMEALSKKAKVLRQDLEAATKARSKLMQQSRAEDVQAITALYDQMISLQGLTGQLPALAQRLQTLASLHVDQTTWAQRLSQTEQIAQHTEGTIQQLEESLQRVEKGLEENSQQWQANWQTLSDRLDSKSN